MSRLKFYEQQSLAHTNTQKYGKKFDLELNYLFIPWGLRDLGYILHLF